MLVLVLRCLLSNTVLDNRVIEPEILPLSEMLLGVRILAIEALSCRRGRTQWRKLKVFIVICLMSLNPIHPQDSGL